VILDEPTSSLDGHTASQLFAFLRRSVGEGMSCILISHMLGEILDCSDRIVVMRDGAVCASGPAGDFDRDALVLAMGGHEPEPHRDPVAARVPGTGAPAPILVQARAARQRDDLTLTARQGEIVGLAGLAAHGQTDILLSIFDAATGRTGRASVMGRVAFVAGDRRRDGVFPQWSIARNITVRSLGRLTRGGLVSRDRSRAMAQEWRERIGIRTPDIHAPILSLSGGNQQKALFARALASDAQIILMDDPMRGVDIGTKLDVYALIRREAESGRTFLWYTTEMEELEHCDRVYVFRNGAIVAELGPGDITEENVIRASFAEAA
jgi:ribose transport system ATP-binding protein